MDRPCPGCLFPLIGLLILTWAITATGCAALEPVGNAWRTSMSSLRPRADDVYDAQDDEGEEWVKSAGEEARGDRPVDWDDDPVREWWLSPRANAIERNLGLDGP